MISEHILKRPLKNIKRHKRTMVIAIAGVEAGVGVTHLALMMGHYLVKKRLRVALIECNSNDAYARIEQAYEGSEEVLMTSKFRAKGIDYYKRMTVKQLGDIYRASYDMVILDIGCNLKGYREELLRADRTFILGYYSDWKAWLYQRFILSQNELLTSRCRLLINLGDEEGIRNIKKRSGVGSYRMPCISDPFVKSKAATVFLDMIMGDI